jgi:hypothetical protein
MFKIRSNAVLAYDILMKSNNNNNYYTQLKQSLTPTQTATLRRLVSYCTGGAADVVAFRMQEKCM